MNLSKWVCVLFACCACYGCKETEPTVNRNVKGLDKVQPGLFIHWGFFPEIANRDLEMVATIDYEWEYEKNGYVWKSPKELLCSLIECASRGVNYMIDGSPKVGGLMLRPNIDIMDYIDKWMRVNSESVYGTTANPFNDNFPWGYVTQKENILYLYLSRRPVGDCIVLKGMLSPIEKATVLATGEELLISDEEICRLAMPAGLDYGQVPVLKLVCKEPVRISDANYMNENVISIPVSSGTVVPGPEGALSIAEGGYTRNFHAGTGKLQLKCEIDASGEYLVRVFTSRHWRRSFAEGARMTLKIGDKLFDSVVLQKDGELANVRQNSYPESWSDVGTVSFNREGTWKIELSVNETGISGTSCIPGEDVRNESDDNIRFLRIELIRQE